MSDREYTLPGVMHYLQQEFTRNESNRIHWNSEREEMKLAIARLTSENNALKQTNQRIEKELAEAKKGKSSTNNQTNHIQTNGLPVSQLNIEPLKKAREHLKSRMTEVVYLLKGSEPDMLDTIGLKKQRGVLALAERKKKRVTDSAAEVSIAHQQIDGAPATPEPDSPSQFLKKGATPEITELTEEGPDMNCAYPEDETDTETVMADEDVPGLSSPPPQSTQTVITEPVFSLASHPSNIISIAVANDKLLTASKEGDIMSWPLSKMVADPTETKSSQSFFDTGTPMFLRWIDNNSFISASKNEVRFWNCGQTEKPKAQINTKTDIKDVQISCNTMVILDSSGLNIYELPNKTVANKNQPKNLTNTQDCQCFILTVSRIYAYSEHRVDEFDIKSHLNVHTHPLHEQFTSPVTKMAICDNTLALTSIDKCIFFDTSTQESWSITPAKGAQLVECIPSKKYYTLFYANGDVEVYTRSDDKLFKKLNHYSQVVMDEALNRLVSSGVGCVYQNYIITGGEDMQVRGWKFA